MRLPDPDALITAALAEPPELADPSLDDLEAEPDGLDEDPEPGFPPRGRQVRAVPLVIRSTAAPEGSPPSAILLAADARVQRVRGDEIRLAAATSVTAGMTLIGVSEPERRTLFERARPILAGQRPQAAALLLQLWRIALDDARAASGSAAELARMLADRGASASEEAVRKWSDPARIGPSDPGQRGTDRQDRRQRSRRRGSRPHRRGHAAGQDPARQDRRGPGQAGRLARQQRQPRPGQGS